MKNLFLYLLIMSSLSVWAQDEAMDSNNLEVETALSPDESYEADLFAQKQDEATFAAGTLSEDSQEYLSEEEVYDSETDY